MAVDPREGSEDSEDEDEASSTEPSFVSDSDQDDSGALEDANSAVGDGSSTETSDPERGVSWCEAGLGCDAEAWVAYRSGERCAAED